MIKDILSEVRISLIKLLIDLNERIFFERKLKKFYKKIFGNLLYTVIDVGANKGQSIDFFLSINPGCLIYAIEPNPKLYSKLKEKYMDKENVKLFNVGISDFIGEKEFHENIFDYTSSFEELNLNSSYLKKKAKVLGADPENIIAKSYMVNVVTLFDFLGSNLIEKIDILKVDTEGHEYYCLSGLFSKKNSMEIKYIQIESHNDDMYKNNVSFVTINDILNQNQFYETHRINHGFGDFDEVVFKNSSLKL
jgi:FkbM family methyltransferase